MFAVRIIHVDIVCNTRFACKSEDFDNVLTFYFNISALLMHFICQCFNHLFYFQLSADLHNFFNIDTFIQHSVTPTNLFILIGTPCILCFCVSLFIANHKILPLTACSIKLNVFLNSNLLRFNCLRCTVIKKIDFKKIPTI